MLKIECCVADGLEDNIPAMKQHYSEFKNWFKNRMSDGTLTGDEVATKLEEISKLSERASISCRWWLEAKYRSWYDSENVLGKWEEMGEC
jgi:hypothetical protein